VADDNGLTEREQRCIRADIETVASVLLHGINGCGYIGSDETSLCYALVDSVLLRLDAALPRQLALPPGEAP
jgi:hypothetical protein